MIQGKTTFKSLVVFYFATISVSVDEKLNSTADIENPNIIWQHNINQILNPDYCASVNITVPPRDVLSFIVSSNLDSKSDSFVLDRIKDDHSAVFFMMLGNLYKSPKDSDSEQTYLDKYQKYIFDNRKLSELLRSKPFVYSFK